MTGEKLTEQRDGQNVIALRQDGKRRWAIASAGMGEKSTRFLYGEYADKLAEYEKIGTPDECCEAVEKQKAKKPIPIDYKKYMDVVDNAVFLRGAYWCPSCNHDVRSGEYCNDCGQKLDWSDKE